MMYLLLQQEFDLYFLDNVSLSFLNNDLRARVSMTFQN